MPEVADPSPALEGAGPLPVREHAGREVPGALEGPGVSAEDGADHPAWDAGALKWAPAS